MRPIFSPAVYYSLQDILSSDSIKKGDGVAMFHDGELTWHRWPAKEGFKKYGYEDNLGLGIEGAPFAHTGDAHSEMSPEEGGTEHGVRGSGHKIEGKWELGKFGELLERDGSGGFHMHGIDGVIHGIGNLFEDIKKQYPQIGLPDDPTLAKQIVQMGIDNWNENNPSNIHPEVNSPELRQKVISSFDKGNNSLRSDDGRFITLHTNANAQGHHLGMNVESAAFKPFQQVSNVLTQLLTPMMKPFVPEAQNNPNWKWSPSTSGLNFLQMPYVYADHLTYSMNPATGEVSSRAKHTKMGEITSDANFRIPRGMKQHFASAGFNADSAFTDNAADSLIAGDLLHPEFYTEKPDKKGTTSYEKRKHGSFTGGNAMGNLFEMINRILPEEHKNPNADSTHSFRGDVPTSAIDMNNPILNELTWINDTPKWNPLSGKYEQSDNRVHTLREALESWKDARHIGNPDDVTRSLANDFLYHMDSLLATSTLAGDNSNKNARKEGQDGRVRLGSRHLRIDNALRDMIGEEGREGVGHLNTQDIFNHSSGLAQFLGGSNPDGRVKGMKIHGKAAERAAKQQVNPNLNNMKIPEELKTKYGIDGVVGPHTEKKSNILRFLAGEMVNARGGEPARHLTNEELLEVQPMGNAQMTNIKGGSPDADLGIPEHVQHAMVSPAMNTRGGQTPPVATPPVATPPVVDTSTTSTGAPLKPTITSRGQVQVRPSGQMTLGDFPSTPSQLPSPPPPNFRSLLPSPVAARQQASQTPEGTEQAMRDIAQNPRLRITEEQRQRAQSAFADPQQTLLTDFQKAEKLINMMERLQLTDAFADENVLKHVPNNNLNKSSNIDVNFMAERLNMTSQDVRTILHTKGDWERIHKTYGYSDTIVKAVKVSFSGGLK